MSTILIAEAFLEEGTISEFLSNAKILELIERIRINVLPTGNTIYPMHDDQSRLLELETLPNHPWFKAMCQIGLCDRGTPYDGLGHGEVTIRLWWAISPNVENYKEAMWFVEFWLGGAYAKTVEILDEKGQWLTVLSYPNQNTRYLEIHPSGRIINL